MITRRSLLKLLLASATAEAVDFEKLLWTPKPIITVPGLLPNLWEVPYETNGLVLARVWEEYVGMPTEDIVFSSNWLLGHLK